ncbi:MAG: single-stranded DNA-binding protein [Candidatus Pacebacteria bacterium]|nr:single-stranded DNA-binding protein [Candidatus Paceibacterota bacterium]
MNLNKAFIFGNLTKDPELKSLPSGTKVVSFGVATNRTWKDKDGVKQEDTTFHNIVAFGKQAEVLAQYMKKGKSIFVEGRITNRSWDDKDGTKKYRSEITLENFQFGPSLPTGGAGYQGDSSHKDSESSSTKTSSPAMDTIEYPTEEINPEDIPF